jgi:hypothetical protein
MPKMLITGAGGLFTSISDFVKPPNAMAEATNVILRDAGIIESRRGMIKQASGYDVSLTANPFSRLLTYGDTLYFLKFSKLYYDTGTAWSSVSTTIGSAIQGKTLNTLPEQNSSEYLQNLYVCSQNGLYMSDTVGAQLYKAGFSTPAPVVNAAYGGYAAGTWTAGAGGANGEGGFLWVDQNNLVAAVAYRVVWGRKDAHDRIFYSEPSARTVVQKTGTANQTFSVIGDVPTAPETSSSTFYQVFRSTTVSRDQDTSVPPSDNMYQVYEGMGANALTLTGAAGSSATKAGGGSSTVTVDKTAHGYRVGMTILPVFAAGDMGAGKFYAASPYATFKVLTVADANTFTYNDTLANAGAPYTNLTSASIVPKYYPFKDQSPDGILFQPLYTNPLDGSEPQPNVQPPAACDIATWKNRMWFANTNGLHAYTITLVGIKDATLSTTNNPDGLIADDTITLDGMAFIAKASPTTGGLEFKFSTGGATPGVNIDTTARSLVDTINNYTGNTTIRAHYLPGDADWPGKIRIERLNQSDSSFAVAVKNKSAWAPYIPNGSTSKNDNFVNRL